MFPSLKLKLYSFSLWITFKWISKSFLDRKVSKGKMTSFSEWKVDEKYSEAHEEEYGRTLFVPENFNPSPSHDYLVSSGTVVFIPAEEISLDSFLCYIDSARNSFAEKVVLNGKDGRTEFRGQINSPQKLEPDGGKWEIFVTLSQSYKGEVRLENIKLEVKEKTRKLKEKDEFCVVM